MPLQVPKSYVMPEKVLRMERGISPQSASPDTPAMNSRQQCRSLRIHSTDAEWASVEKAWISASDSVSATHCGPSGRNSSQMRLTTEWPGSERRKPMSGWMSGSSPAEKMMVIASPNHLIYLSIVAYRLSFL